ncbi:MAG TPA: acyl-CoA dehydrogenase family protein [Novosphingobium sp.]|nr:acyl-CoA dehydrogenase family protein [Novosphingobium sp.]
MRGVVPPADSRLIAIQFEAAPGLSRLRALKESFGVATPDLVEAVLDEAARFSSGFLAPLNDIGDRQGCALIDGRVRTPAGHREAYDAYVAGGWTTLDQPVDRGGQGLPLSLAFAVQEIFDRGCPAFGMLPVPQRSAARLIAAFGDAAMKAEWLEPLIAGEWAATICISEADAGSDLGRLRTRAERLGDGEWAITGEKNWISFGDHDLTARIGHCLLARTAGVEGLSLFLVPDSFGEERNGVVVRRIEEKLGLHVSPTCALGFEGARGHLIGTEGRGLQQMFVMITNMRLATGAQGLAIAAGAADLALAYARDRRQGGSPNPVPINRHPDVQRMLLEQAAKVEVLRGLLLAAANYGDLGACEPDEGARKDAAALLQWLLPLVKTTGGEFAFEVASDAVQVLGGAGYTREWPAEQMLRDARVLTIFEGTTGIQALDLLHRRLHGDRRGLRTFLALARKDAVSAQAGGALLPVLDLLEDAAERLIATADPRAAEAGATAFLHLAALAATGWIAARLVAIEDSSREAERLRAAGRHWLTLLLPRARAHHAESLAGLDLLEGFEQIDAC